MPQREFEPYELEIIRDLLDNKPERVSSNERQRYYSEDVSDRNYDQTHHLIDVDQQHGRNYCKLHIHQFTSHAPERNCTVTLTANEVEELLAVVLQQRFSKAKEEVEAGQRSRVPALGPGGDFDPFLDTDDLP